MLRNGEYSTNPHAVRKRKQYNKRKELLAEQNAAKRQAEGQGRTERIINEHLKYRVATGQATVQDKQKWLVLTGQVIAITPRPELPPKPAPPKPEQPLHTLWKVKELLAAIEERRKAGTMTESDVENFKKFSDPSTLSASPLALLNRSNPQT